MNEQNPTQSDTKQVFKALRGKKKLMIETLNNHLGMVAASCRQVGIHRDTHYAWLKEDPNYKHWAEEAQLNLKDFGETALFKLIKEGNPMVVWNFNKTKNRDRGYGERLEIKHSGGMSPIFSKEERAAEIKRLLGK